MYPRGSPKYPKGSPKYNLMQSKTMGRKVGKKPSPKVSKRDTSPRGIHFSQYAVC
jgi:hypothetical protein